MPNAQCPSAGATQEGHPGATASEKGGHKEERRAKEKHQEKQQAAEPVSSLRADLSGMGLSQEEMSVACHFLFPRSCVLSCFFPALPSLM